MKDYQFPIQILKGRTYPVVGEIFSSVNSQGTQLTGAEIHLARIVPYWRGITKEFRIYRKKLRDIDYEFDLTLLMRAITVIECGVPQIKKLAEKVSSRKTNKQTLKRQWRLSVKSIDMIIKVLRDDLLLDKTKFFTSKNVMIPLIYYASQLSSAKVKMRKKDIMRFFLISQLSGHYGSAVETVLRRDLRILSDPYSNINSAIRELNNQIINQAKQWYRGLRIRKDDISGPRKKCYTSIYVYFNEKE